ncbi:hypothetical protein Bateq7PJ16_1152 [Bacillus subtilis]|nr:hypothetical protein Bateq7PJ16_1152 [Bacillus subtilis]
MLFFCKLFCGQDDQLLNCCVVKQDFPVSRTFSSHLKNNW